MHHHQRQVSIRTHATWHAHPYATTQTKDTMQETKPREANKRCAKKAKQSKSGTQNKANQGSSRAKRTVVDGAVAAATQPRGHGRARLDAAHTSINRGAIRGQGVHWVLLFSRRVPIRVHGRRIELEQRNVRRGRVSPISPRAQALSVPIALHGGCVWCLVVFQASFVFSLLACFFFFFF